MPNKRNLSDSFGPRSPDPNTNKNKKLFITKNRYELLQVEPQITQNSTTETQNSTSETPNYVNPIKPPPTIFVEDKTTCVVLRNLHPTTSTELIKSELELRLFKVRKVTNVLHKTSKSPLPLFFVDLEPSDNSIDIFKLSSFLHTKIKVEELYKPKVISQCLNCQDYGHTRAYYGYPARCIRCSAFHLSSECTKTPNHPLPTSSGNNSAAPSKTYAQATSSQPSQSSSSTPPSDLTVTISSFVDELKSLINPLIALLTQSLLFDKRIDIALISETHFIEYSYISISGYSLIKFNHPDGTAHGGAAILIKSSLKYYSLVNYFQNISQSCAISITINNIPVAISSIYSPPKHCLTIDNLTDFFYTTANNFIIGDDYNAKNQS
ncbi:Uncharacterized protein FWK35_00008849 [Aphis craccivora]|uniref:Pre-C2HC domain-containing protein n=1 Tax=Aphis craccivora TaxID=307492 RepID=A0A6G0YIS7_APHCR|nr:Uncharacterized protein FWK35_00008849 [Aphis craccivora]